MVTMLTRPLWAHIKMVTLSFVIVVGKKIFILINAGSDVGKLMVETAPMTYVPTAIC